MLLIKLLLLTAFLLMLAAAIALYHENSEPTPFVGFLIFLINGCIYIMAIGVMVLIMLQMIFD